MTTLRNFGNWALVTGANSGIGLAYANALARRGFNLLLVARRKAELEKIAKEIALNDTVQTRTLSLNLSDPANLQQLFDAARELDIGVVVSNAGAGGLGAFLDRPVHEHLQMMTLNGDAHLAILHHFASVFRARPKRGAILLAASTAGLHGMPYGATYSAAKAAVISLAESVNVELRGTGVHVTAVSPGFTDTPGTRHDEVLDFSKLPMPAMSADDVVAEGLAALSRNDAHHIPGRLNRVMSGFEARIVGRGRAVRLMGGIVKKALRRNGGAVADLSQRRPATNLG